MKLGKVLLGLTALALGLLLFFTLDKPAEDNQTPSPEKQTSSKPATKPAQKLILGKASAPVTIVEYGDFQCPICKKFYEETEPALRREFIDNGKAKIEFRVETHIGEESVLAGQAAWCANDQQAFPKYHDELYIRQSGSNNGTFSKQNLKVIAADLGLDRQKFAGCLDSDKYKSRVIDSNAKAQAGGVTATPTFFIGERKIVGAQPIGIFRAILNESR